MTFVSTVPTAKMRAGDFSELSSPIYDPTTAARAAFAGNVIPSNRLDPIALQLHRAVSAADQRRPGQQLHLHDDRTQDSCTADFRVDHRFNDNNIAVRALFVQQRRHVHAVGCAADRGRHRAGLRRRAAFPGPNTTKAHGVQANYLRIHSGPRWSPSSSVGYLQGRHPVAAAQLRQEPEPASSASQARISMRSRRL